MDIKMVATVLLTTISGVAYGQSSVTLYGIVDTGLSYYNNATSKGGSVYAMSSLTGEVPSRWGLKGSEDLGHGYKAFFVLENGFLPNSGALGYGGRLFGRQANVGVSSSGYGSITLGRQINMTIYTIAKADLIGPSVHALSNLDPYLPNARSDNAIGYMGTFSGWTVGGTYSFGRDAAGPAGPSATNCAGEIAGNFQACKQYTAMLAYDEKNFGVAASYDTMRGGAGASAPLTISSYTNTHNIVDAYFKTDKAKFGIGWVRDNVAAAVHLQSDIFFVNGTYFLTPALSFDTQAARYVQRGSGEDSNATMLVGRANYHLSPRTTLYSSVGYVFNSATSAKAIAVGGTVGTGMNQLGVAVGIQQAF
ncbi:porin [Paraburkholderia xenovorans]|uniref:porin n=1 Tax=Paraburkholderia xenovorans TaxID=36873 RepID=UPI0038BC4B69